MLSTSMTEKVHNERPDLAEIGKLPNTIVIGSTGFLGSHFAAVYRGVNRNLIATSHKRGESPNTFFLDLTCPNITLLPLGEKQVEDALLLAGITEVARCEKEKELTWKVNVNGCLELIRQFVEEGIKPVVFSSDYVFDGTAGSYTDYSSADPTTEYGRQKAEIEARIGEITRGDHLVVRLSKVFGVKKRDGTLLDEMAEMLAAGSVVRAAYDQVFCPTFVEDIVKAVAMLQTIGATGLFNVCSPEAWSRYDLAIAVATALGVEADYVERTSIDDIKGPRRPKNTSMKAVRLLKEIDFRFTPLTESIERVALNWRKTLCKTTGKKKLGRK